MLQYNPKNKIIVILLKCLTIGNTVLFVQNDLIRLKKKYQRHVFNQFSIEKLIRYKPIIREKNNIKTPNKSNEMNLGDFVCHYCLNLAILLDKKESNSTSNDSGKIQPNLSNEIPTETFDIGINNSEFIEPSLDNSNSFLTKSLLAPRDPNTDLNNNVKIDSNSVRNSESKSDEC